MLPAISPSSAFDAPLSSLLLVNGAEQQAILIRNLPFTIGRKPGNDVVLADPRVSREHAQIVREGTEYVLVDLSSKLGTFVNGQRVARHRLQNHDRLEFGSREGVYLLFASDAPTPVATQQLLGRIGELSSASELEKLSLLLEAARKLNGTRVLEDVLPTLLELTLRLTKAERSYIFLRESQGRLRLAAGRDAQGRPLADDTTISRSILNQAADSGCEFLLTDTSRFSDVEAHNSIIAFDLRTVICIPLCAGPRPPAESTNTDAVAPASSGQVRGVLYLDSHVTSHAMTGTGDDVLRALAREVASLLENAYLVQAEAAARGYQQELAIAASIQQGLMNISVPEVPFATIHARSVPCREIGGDFFDVVRTDEGLVALVADISGKGISAALLASTLQGFIASQLMANMPLTHVAAAVNAFLCHKRVESKYATLALALLTPNGELEVVNCGHVLPLLLSRDRGSTFMEGSNMPVGLFAEATYENIRCRLNPGERLLLYSDGITEAANAQDEFFGDARLQQAAIANSPVDEIFAQVNTFTGNKPADDDCTLLEVRYGSCG